MSTLQRAVIPVKEPVAFHNSVIVERSDSTKQRRNRWLLLRSERDRIRTLA